MAIFTVHVFYAGSDASCSYSDNKEQRAHIRKYSDYLGLPMTASETKSFISSQQNLSST